VSLPGCGIFAEDDIHLGAKMLQTLNKIAWFAAALAILAWAFMPNLVSAHTVMMPKVPLVVATALAPPTVPAPQTLFPQFRRSPTK
jgi:hypothetical protein